MTFDLGLSVWSVKGQKDTEEIERSGYVNDGVSGLWLFTRRKLDDLLRRLEELRHASPGAVAFRTLRRTHTHTHLDCAKV